MAELKTWNRPSESALAERHYNFHESGTRTPMGTACRTIFGSSPLPESRPRGWNLLMTGLDPQNPYPSLACGLSCSMTGTRRLCHLEVFLMSFVQAWSFGWNGTKVFNEIWTKKKLELECHLRGRLVPPPESDCNRLRRRRKIRLKKLNMWRACQARLTCYYLHQCHKICGGHVR